MMGRSSLLTLKLPTIAPYNLEFADNYGAIYA